MNSSSHAAAAREYRAILSAEGYVHKFRLEGSEDVSTKEGPADLGTPTVGLAPLLGKVALIARVFAGLAAAAARVLT